MSPVTSRARCKWATKLVAAAGTLGLVGCDSISGWPGGALQILVGARGGRASQPPSPCRPRTTCH